MAQNYVDILVRARDQGAKPEMDDLRVKLNDLQGRVAEARALVDDEAAAAKLDDLQAKLLRLDKTTARPKITMDQAVRAEGQIHALEAAFADFGQKADAATQKAGKDLDDLGAKAKQTAKSAGDGMSPLLVSAFTVAAAAGPAALLAGTSAAIVGIGALVTKNNNELTASYAKLAGDASDAITEATAPMVPAISASVDILDQGLSKAKPQIDSLFKIAAPEAQQMATGVSSLVSNALPGLVTGLKAAAPYGGVLADTLGKLGTGAGGLFSGLASGAQGGAIGLEALATVAEHLLTDAGQITGALSRGLGPALHDVATVAVPVADALTHVVDALPPNSVRVTADAVAVLFTAFKAGQIAGIVKEGTTFTQWLGVTKTQAAAATVEVEALGTAEEATAAKTGLMSAAAGAAFGPIGLIAGAFGLASLQSTFATGSFAKLNQALEDAAAKKKADAEAAKEQAAAQEKANAAAVKAAQTTDSLTLSLTSQVGVAGQSAEAAAVANLASLGLTDGTSRLTDQLYRTEIAYTTATTGAQAYNTAITVLNGTTAGLDDAQNQMAQTLLDLKTSFKQNSDSMSLSTQAGISNREALSSAAKSAVALATAQYQASGNMSAANKTLKDQENAIIKATGATGKAKDAVRAYLDQIMKIQDDVTTDVHANVSPALQAVHNAVRTIDNTSAYVQVYATVNNPAGGHQLLAHGGVVGGIGTAATGGARGALTMIDEQGPEIVRLPSGSMVMSHPDTDRYLSRQPSAGPAAVELELVASDDLFLRWLRNAIRVRGGDVQKVLGPAR